MFAWLMVLEGSRGAVYEDFEGRSSVRDLQPKPCSGGELVSLLMGGASGGGPCASVEKVALDPSPEILFDESFDGLDFEVSHMSREGFIEKLIVQGHQARERTRGERGLNLDIAILAQSISAISSLAYTSSSPTCTGVW